MLLLVTSLLCCYLLLVYYAVTCYLFTGLLLVTSLLRSLSIADFGVYLISHLLADVCVPVIDKLFAYTRHWIQTVK